MAKHRLAKWAALAAVAASAIGWSGQDTIREHVLAARSNEQAGFADPEETLASELYAGFASGESSFDMTYAGDRKKLADELPAKIKEAIAKDDYIRYTLASYVYTIRSAGGRSTIHVEARYRETKAQTAYVKAQVKQWISRLVKPGMNDHQKVKVIHDWIVSHVEYDQQLKKYTAYDALTSGYAVCQGYSLLGYRMLQEAGLTALIAEGKVNTGDHAWNMVKLDGKWYHLDLTWDDPVVHQPPSARKPKILSATPIICGRMSSLLKIIPGRLFIRRPIQATMIRSNRSCGAERLLTRLPMPSCGTSWGCSGWMRSIR
ncbi:transglutaminase domain-containing protein [Paenibacillus protaetiae]|uniref:Transglutaminase-like domain-containing protein n=1 Tax=Paenibacillus protaetiae TaxID=2509456 RepID=A0A4P6EZ31_9BACL|nr:transglutaminase domain-containing protein [Paenibacillus protaetiae]QAY68126.1 hypothetical protein ET464_18865 [Paenibacillus protaetiae]